MANVDKRKTLKKSMADAGALLSRDSGYDSLYDVLKALADESRNCVANGLMAAAPTTASTQATGAGATAWRVNLDKGVVKVGGVSKEFAAEADRVLHSATQLVASGQSCIAAIVAKKDAAGAITLINVKGAAATTASVKAPTDAEIQAAVGAGLDWVKVAECQINRTADTTVTQAQDNTKADLAGHLLALE